MLWLWYGVFFVFAIMSFFFPSSETIIYVLTAQQISTIAGSLVAIALVFKRTKKAWWHNALRVFFIVSAIFLVMLVLDILITNLPIASLGAIDNLSLPVYLLSLNIGIFFFASSYLSRDALVENNHLTDICVDFYHLTSREVDVIENVLNGKTNKEIGDLLFISVKTVENHLYNIYQKVDVTSRGQLIHTLQTWGRD
jgi:DNA-binding CsgD family transcriptional regulator